MVFSMNRGSGYILEVQCPDVDFSIEFYVERERSVKFIRDELIRVTTADGVKYFALLDTESVGRGNLMARVVLFDNEAHWNNKRPVIMSGFTGYFIGNCLCGIGGGFGCQGYSFAFTMVDDIPKDINSQIYYGVIKEWVTGYEYITEKMVGSLNRIAVGKFDTSIDVKEGDRVVVLIPYEEYLTAKKMSVFGEDFATSLPFSTQVMGANGEITLYVDRIKYRVFGEFMTVEGKLFLKIE